MSKTYNFFAYLGRMKYIKRWSLMKSTQEENILEHSAMVAQISHALAIIAKNIFGKDVDVDKCSTLAIYHDCSEVITGDLPTPIKYFNEDIKKAYKSLEGVASNKLLQMLPEELKPEMQANLFPDKNSIEYEIVKYADRIAAYLKCVEEVKFGNREFSKALKSNKALIDKIKSEEVKYFMQVFAPSYDLTLDELE